MTDQIQLLAADTVCVGRLNEPRVYFDRITIDPAQSTSVITPGSPGVFRNSEDFPVQIRKILIGTDLGTVVDGTAVPADERLLARVGMRIRNHDHYYMSRQFVAMPLWTNALTQAPVAVAEGTSTWVFPHPVVLSARDTLRVRVAARSPGDSNRYIRVAFHGVGRLTERPYFFESETLLTDFLQTTLDTVPFRNDGAEPINLTHMVCDVSSSTTSLDPTGDSRTVDLQISQVGNGTSADWFKGPTVPVAITRCPAHMIGGTLTRAIVHDLPGSGWIWEPGEGVQVDLQRLGDLCPPPAPEPPPDGGGGDGEPRGEPKIAIAIAPPVDCPPYNIYISMLGHISVT